MKSRKTAVVFILAAFIISCRMALPLPAEKDLTRAHNIDQHADVQALRDGQKLYMAKCGNCHYLHRPDEFDAAKWNEVLPGMKDDAKLTDPEFNSIRLYLLTMCKHESAATNNLLKK